VRTISPRREAVGQFVEHFHHAQLQAQQSESVLRQSLKSPAMITGSPSGAESLTH
jgi:uncharacterized membrane protein